MPPLSARTLFSRSALTQYFNHIVLPSKFHSPPSEGSLRSTDEGLSYLRTLQKYQQATVPFANLYLHYSRHHVSTLNSLELFDYIVNGGGMAREGEHGGGIEGLGWRDPHPLQAEFRQRAVPNGKAGIRSGRGGSCSLNNGFFGTVMRSLGYDVLSSAARVAKAANGGPKEIFGGWDHVVNLVSMEGRKYLVDVGFGGNGPTEPILLEDGAETRWGVTEDYMRVVWKRLPQFTDPRSRCWVLQHRRGGRKEWADVYAFTEMEFLPEDFEVMNYRSTRDPRSWFNQKVVCVKTVLEGEDDEVAGVIMLTGRKVKRRTRGRNETVEECQTETERVQALEKHFGIVLTEQERMGIRGMVTELKR